MDKLKDYIKTLLKLAIQNNPEVLKVVRMAKVENDKWITIHPNGEDSKGRPLLLKDGENVYDAMRRQWDISSPGQQHLFSVSKYKTDDSYKKELDAKIAELNKQVEKSRKEEAKRKEEAIETDIQKLDKNAYILKYADKLGWLDAAEKWDKGQKADNGINPNYKEELKQVIDKAKNNPTEHQKLVIGKVSPELEEKAKENGFDISGYQHDLDVSGTRHAIKEHGQPKTEEPRGQIAITDGDFEKIPEVIYGYDDVSFTGKNKIGRETITYKKAFDDGTIMYVEEIRDKRKTLTINTMYKYKNTGNPRTFVDNNNPLSNASIYIITDIQEDFNPNMNKHKIDNDKWITIHPNGEDSKGRPLLLKDGETPKEAIERTYKKEELTEENKKYTWQDQKYSLQDLVDAGFEPIKYTSSIYKDDPLTYLAKEEGKKYYRMPLTESEYQDALKAKENKKANALQKAKKASKDLIDYVKWQYNEDIEPYITRKEGDKTIVDWYDLPRGAKSALQQIQRGGRLVLDMYSGREMSIEIKDKKILENLQRHRANNNKEQNMALLYELKKLITKVENDKVTCKRSAKRRCV